MIKRTGHSLSPVALICNMAPPVHDHINHNRPLKGCLVSRRQDLEFKICTGKNRLEHHSLIQSIMAWQQHEAVPK